MKNTKRPQINKNKLNSKPGVEGKIIKIRAQINKIKTQKNQYKESTKQKIGFLKR
jgi:hypothetical protein